jgi:hypothetical protein
MVTRAAIDARLKQLRVSLANMESDLARLTAHANANRGAIEDCEYWLSLVDNSDTTDNAGAYGSSREDADRTDRA